MTSKQLPTPQTPPESQSASSLQEAPSPLPLPTNSPTSTVYGPVNSWRVGQSLGVDLLFRTSICSFRCIYCQLGKIEEHTAKRDVYVTTEQVMADLAASAWQDADIVTLSGSGEPTLALNLPEVIAGIKAFTGKPVMVLTNSTTLGDPQVRQDLMAADRVYCKLDAADDRMLQLVDRPVEGVTVRSIVDGIVALRREFGGYLAVQSMFMPVNLQAIEAFAALLREINPDEVQLNTPLRPVPKGWYIEARGNHERDQAPYEAVALKTITREDALALEAKLRELTGLLIVSVYKD